MKYIVTRTSKCGIDNPEAPGVEKEMLPAFIGREETELKEAYTIELNTLEDLNMFRDECEHPLVLFSKDSYGFNIPEIEIYDDYRE